MTDLRVFLSRPNVLTRAQDEAVDRWVGALRSMGMELLSLCPRSFDESLWRELRAGLERADGVVILGLRQLRVDRGCWRPGTTQSTSSRRWWPTPWNQVEAGMAIMAGLPSLVLRERGVTGGIFDKSVWDEVVYGAELDDPLGHPSVKSWAADVARRRAIAARAS